MKYKITLIKSLISCSPNQKACLKGLGLKKIRKSVIRDVNPCITGMIKKVTHLVSVERIS